MNTIRSAKRKHTFASALGIFALASLVWGASGIGRMRPDDFSFYTWTSAAIHDFLSKSTGRPQIDFVGSSLMLVPLGGVDADYRRKAMDLPHHHHSEYVEDKLKTATGKNFNTFVFALPGEMPSDAALITKFLLRGKKKPDVLVYGVGPRDFLDSTLTSPGATDPYQSLSRFGDVSDRINLIAPDWQERFNYFLGRLVYPYGEKFELSNRFTRIVTAGADKLLPVEPMSLLKRRHVLPNFRPFEVGVKDCLWEPSNPQTRAFKDNIAEYRKRYKQFKWDTYLTQMQFLADLLNVSRERGVRVVLIAMPITDVNRRLMSDLTWDTYRRGVKVLAQSKGATYIDVEGMNRFNTGDFLDTVHLHAVGGKKLLDILCARMVVDPAISSALHITKSDIAAANAGAAKLAQANKNKPGAKTGGSKVASSWGGTQL